MSTDGYIYATKLCQIANKRLDKWRSSPETQQIIEFLIKYLKLDEKDLIKIKRGGNDKHKQGTWVHPDLGIHLAQWCNPIFSIQVSRWIRELIITGDVKLGNEKSDEQIQQSLQEKLQYAEQLNVSLTNENKFLQEKYDKLYLNHQYYLKRKKLQKLPNGRCVYIVSTPGDNNDTKLKIGKSENITDRISGFRTISPFCKLEFLMYTDKHHLIESQMKSIYEDNRPNDREFITGIPFEDIKQHFIEMATALRSNYTIETTENLQEFNQHIVTQEEAVEIIDKMTEEEKDEIVCPTTKRCGGQWHTSEEDRIVPMNMFYLNKSHKDGRARLCKNCYARAQNRQGYNTAISRKKPLPEFNPNTHKWCNLCENVKILDEFYNQSVSKDGKCANCKECKQTNKREKRINNKKKLKYNKSNFQ